MKITKSFFCKFVFWSPALVSAFCQPLSCSQWALSLSMQRKERGAWSWLGLACVDVVVLFQTTYHHPPLPRFSKEWKCPMVFWKVCMLFPALFFFLTSLFSLAHHCFGLLFRFEVVCFISSSTKLICVWFNRYWKITYSLRWMNRCLLFW